MDGIDKGWLGNSVRTVVDRRLNGTSRRSQSPCEAGASLASIQGSILSKLESILIGLFVNKMYPALKPVVKDKRLHLDRPLWFTMWDTKNAM